MSKPALMSCAGPQPTTNLGKGVVLVSVGRGDLVALYLQQ